MDAWDEESEGEDAYYDNIANYDDDFVEGEEFYEDFVDDDEFYEE